MLVLLFALLATTTLAGTNTPTSAGSALSANNPVAQIVVLCSALFGASVSAQFTNGDEDSSDEFKQGTFTNVVLDDDDNDFGGNDINEKFGTSPQGFIQF